MRGPVLSAAVALVAAGSLTQAADEPGHPGTAEKTSEPLHIKTNCLVHGLEIAGADTQDGQIVLQANVLVSGDGCEQLLALLNYPGVSERFEFSAVSVEPPSEPVDKTSPPRRCPQPVPSHFDLIYGIDPGPS